MGIEMINGGALTTVQDRGRYGGQETGMAVCGVMDQRSAALANFLVGNAEDEAVLEATVLGPSFRVTEDNFLAVTGGDLRPELDGVPLAPYTAVFVRAGQVLSFGGPSSGCRAYLAFAGGLDVPLVMGSRSTDLRAGIGGLGGRKLTAGDRIGFRSPKHVLPNLSRRNMAPEDFSPTEHVLRVVMGPQDDYFSEEGIHTFLESVYTVSGETDRMGCRLDGPKISHRLGADIITDGISLGAIQVPSGGTPIIMMADHQTTGGYTKIGAVISEDLPILAQSVPGHRIRFCRVGIEEAQDLYCRGRERLMQIQKELNEETALLEEETAIGIAAAAAENMKGWSKAGTYRIVVNGKEFFVDLEREEKLFRERK